MLCQRVCLFLRVFWEGLANQSCKLKNQWTVKEAIEKRPRQNKPKIVNSWKVTKEYLNHKGTKIRVFRGHFRAPFLPPFFPHFSPLFPLQGLFTLPPLLPSSPPQNPPVFTPGKLRFMYPSDLGTL